MLRSDFYSFIRATFPIVSPSSAFAPNWQILLQKSPRRSCRIKIRNNRSGANGFLNQRCALTPDLESILRTQTGKILLQQNRHIEAIAFALMRVLRGEIKRLIITVPPRSLKSICASVAFPAFVLGHDPTRRIICVSYAEALARKHANDCRALMRSTLYHRLFRNTRISNAKDTELEFATTRGGNRLATSIGGTLTGRG